ncbi:1-deoxy-D-xylulose-5-phosphate reductoisomerase [Breznakia sp. PF5-3]|uniref:1-deoxy-D-xylulose-5-phosphate reductoisomerase n=1 Tax=unclassified Breznakia TaxID=2623764 RepID=UPI002404F71C|nr:MULTISPECIES: 1-deoxy-D-xylulose-5-phosphate reductoisomerase [unclassified Breznakia]MDF9824402.1 1-deoxy-D-xylulose-5-phosphate reductoisomerase [Breznakia sp. PM6-1]MDF9835131.1 1-deoxy-D-xylulose-5-phosphate reductoisomerase [Breznakia sp. PF5-3]MDF9838220.1 1-deoxy-D-xylulose-5-phosphate reductoisomerase [Breznakia sp. PFB2-8]MDF9860235.1 1-deoxy-D-xylulose-5-phosphate reductoisomerase [Breznakia sp. PH5-24]
MKKIILLGATGSIGTQCLDVVLEHSQTYEIIAMACGKNIAMLEKIIKSYSICKIFSVKEKQDAIYLKGKYPDCDFYYGMDGIMKLLDFPGDVVVNALVGFIGLVPSLKTIENGMDLALANKESLVVGGELIKKALNESEAHMYPIDSEHSAIFQCLQGNDIKNVERLIISASGGSFRDLNRDELKNVTVEQALNHPNWSMGERITIDSATMMNKGFEVIEAYYLFNLPFDKIDVIINTESIVHSMVEYIDRSVIAQLGSADMKIPIQYALSYPNRLPLKQSEPLDLCKIGSLHFKEMNFERYPLLALAFEAGKRGGNSGAILNAADEVAVELFINHKIKFLEIEEYIFMAYKNIEYIEHPTMNDIIKTDKDTRAYLYQLAEVSL